MSLKYRKEIDGLRAVAVLPVILFHAGFSAFSGGYVGVDIFFVISGFLITSIIFKELDQGTFSILNFYERRARRILPALFFIMALCVILGYFWMLPDPLQNMGQSIVASTFFSNNILLTLTSGYWDLAVEFKPLLHTWSLAVEEQYYIVFPIFMAMIWRFGRKFVFASLLFLGLMSLIAAQWGSFKSPIANFYLFPTRAWEILLGAYVAFITTRTEGVPKFPPLWQNVMSGLGLAMIAISIFTFDKYTPFPSICTLVPTVGTALLLLFSSKGTAAYTLLSNRAFVGIGLISYSAYLWHQPVFAFARIYAKTEPSHEVFAALSLLSLVLAWGTWKFVEAPFRNRAHFSRNVIFSLSILISGVFVGIGYYMHTTKGMPNRLASAGQTVFAGQYESYNQQAFQFKQDNFTNTKKLNLLILGNSFGRDTVNMVRETFDMSHVEIIYRDEFYDCIDTYSTMSKPLYQDADIILFAAAHATKSCISEDIQRVTTDGKDAFYIGTKHFGYNLNWVARLSQDKKINLKNDLLPETIAQEKWLQHNIPANNYISLLDPIRQDNSVPITNSKGALLSGDRVHLTQAGAIYFGQRSLQNTRLAQRLN